MSNIKFICSYTATAIDNNFIDNYMAEAPSPVFSLIYIYAYRCAVSEISVSNSEIAKKFSVIESDVIKAWKYWKSVGLISTGRTKDNPYIEFIAGQALSETDAGIKQLSAEKDNFIPKEPERAKIVVAKPVFSPSDISDIIETNPEIGELLKLAESTKGKTISPKETEIIVWMYQSLELPFEVILVLLSFCYKSNKPPRYMEKTALDWIEKGIVTSEAASDYLSFYNNYGKVLKFFGVSDRSTTVNERNYIDKWLKEWLMSFELIELAARRTVENTGKPAFSYCNKILETWHKANFATIKEVEASEANYTGKNKTLKKSGLQQQPKGIFNNYNQKSYGADEIAEILKRKGNVQ